MRGVFSGSLFVVFLLVSARTYGNNELQSNTTTAKCKPYPPSGMPGMPGIPGIPGAPGSPGRDGFKGEKGNNGKRGLQGMGIPGKIGPRGLEGPKGDKGENGTGIPGNTGPRGSKGSKGENGRKGEIGTMGTKGSAGIPGYAGPRGPKGPKGENGRKGEIGTMGAKGRAGIPGNTGPRGSTGYKGDKGRKGEIGRMGKMGSKGIPGYAGPRGPKGSKGENGIGTKGEKGDAANIDPRQLAYWKQCVWREDTTTDNGKLNECSFNKLHSNTALKVSYQGNIRVYTDLACNRWYFKFNGNECSGPMPIDSVLYINWPSSHSSKPTNLSPHSFEGYCENLARGTVSVELWVGKCTGFTLGDARTGWNSVSRIMIEEVPPSQ